MNNIKKIWARVDTAADVLHLEPWLVKKLKGFKKKWGCDIEAKMDNGELESFDGVRVWHRSPHTDQPHKGGLRFHPLVDVEMMKAHAVEMSLKCWIMGIEWGGAKGGIAIDPSKFSQQELKNITEAFVDEMDESNILGPFRDVPAPDVGTTPKIMNWIRQRYAQRRRSREDARFPGVVTGKPVGYGFGGIPGRVEATGYGLVAVLQHMLKQYPIVSGIPRLAIMGFGNVGSHVAYFAHNMGFKVIAVSDINGALYNPNGIDVPTLWTHYNTTKSLIGAANTEPIDPKTLLTLPDCDIFVPAALENVITKKNAETVSARIVLEGANGPTTPEADEILQKRGVLVIPDILANAGGVTVSFFEWARNVNIRDERVPKAHRETVLEAMSQMLVESSKQVIATREQHNVSLRLGAYITAIERTAPLFREKHKA